MKFIHVKCLQEWLNGKKSVRELPFSTIYLYRLAQCELCKVNFPGKYLKPLLPFRLCEGKGKEN
jgi:E3 ubiquitin-protein ligase DOA10